jgi:hypothetical protein
MLAFLAVGGFWFWSLLVVSTILVVASIEADNVVWATITLVVGFLLLGVFGNFNILSYIWNHPGGSALWVLGYFAAGASWSVIKWTFYVLNRKDKYMEYRAKWLEAHDLEGAKEIPEDHKEDFAKHMENNYNAEHDGEALNKRPRASKHKARIATWVSYWPWSMLWSLLGDVLKRFGKWTFTLFHDLYESISKKAYESVENDLPDKLINKSKAA